MPILAVKIENEASLLMNEFFDYNGFCYAVSCSRLTRGAECIALEDFYECTVRSKQIENIPVIFVLDGEIIGWYKKAKIYRELQRISVFLEGNIEAGISEACLLARSQRIGSVNFGFKEKFYEVIESGDERFEFLERLTQRPANGLKISFACSGSFYSGDRLRMIAHQYRDNPEAAKKHQLAFCLEKCGQAAEHVMSDKCQDIRELKTMYDYAKQAVLYDRTSADVWYYMAMACEQLGFVKEGLKAVEKAIDIEPDGDDLLVLKGHLLYALKKYDEAAACYQEAVEINPDDGYFLCLGQVRLAQGNVDSAYKAYKKVSDKEILNECGINLKDMEKRWPFVAVRGFSLKELFKK